MGFIGVQPASVPLTASDITNDIINADKIADNSISEEHLDPTVITGLSALGAEPADTDEFLISDAGTLKRMDYSYIKSGGGALVQVARQTITSGSSVGFEFQNCFTTTYKDYFFRVRNMRPSTDGEGYRMRIMTGTNTKISGSVYRNATSYLRNDGATGTSAGTNTEFTFTNNVASTQAMGGANSSLWISCDKSSTANNSLKVNGTSSFTDQNSNGHRANSAFHGSFITDDLNTYNTTGLYIYVESGNIAEGDFTLYGLVQS